MVPDYHALQSTHLCRRGTTFCYGSQFFRAYTFDPCYALGNIGIERHHRCLLYLWGKDVPKKSGNVAKNNLQMHAERPRHGRSACI